MTKPPLLLLHGVTMSGRAWKELSPSLSERHEVLAPTLRGHRGGVPPERRPVRIRDLVDDMERLLDEKGWETAHLAGNSLGGWIAVELARRGRARTVCALSPAGFWTAGVAEQTHGTTTLRWLARLASATHRLAPVGLAVPPVRKLLLREVAQHGERLSRADATAIVDDLVGCAATMDILASTEEIAPLDPVPCPMTIAWSEYDRILPLDVNGAIARERVPGARFEVLTGVGHVPMIDDPARVVRVIEDATGVREVSGEPVE
ncbi:alpha/beta hydrolase [Nocardia otitidiscaviarum]|uniref:Alpha/beta hydrolase n=1 Tax=Nocardia otitidiscaviarum TaxID=1823 RepID=A0A516NFS6_9NOCA|nr:alpha/beta hydrolase [Nocardia otitidiscaviarum]MCP9623098.1 alpha/beta hydrolase [Nocardia otitidiscaviarum]QDP77762.1 alpha/beta hydrolase [Nocardia otitidiscaviarum]